MTSAQRVGISFIIYGLWVIITLLGGWWLTQGQATLDDMVSSGIGWHFALAIVLLVAAIKVFKWRDLGFRRPHALVKVLWFPSIYLALFAIGIIFTGGPPLSVVLFVALNTLMVGISEELMFRGILFRALEKSLRIWPAIVISCLLFGVVHVLNVVITGELAPALLQSVAAAMSGFVFIAIVLCTGSLWPAMIYHFLWDCLLFLMGHHAATSASQLNEQPSTMLLTAMPILLNMPNLLFVLFLLRKIRPGSPLKFEL